MSDFDVIVIGAGASGLFCAAQAGQLGKRVLVLDKGKRAGRKILMSGGGRCNFTNMYAEPGCYLSNNPHFVKSALARYSQWDFIALVAKHEIAYHEKTLGQLFCDDSAQNIVDMLLKECQDANVTLQMNSDVTKVEKTENGFSLLVNGKTLNVASLVVATGGLSMPKLGVSPLGYQLAEQLGIKVLPVSAALVPFTLHKPLLETLSQLSGIAVPVVISVDSGISFRENLLFTHRGLSGPCVLQLSSYWNSGDFVSVNLLPDTEVDVWLNNQREDHPNQSVKNTLGQLLPKRLVEVLQALEIVPAELSLKQMNHRQQAALEENLTNWRIQPNGTEGYRTAEVTLGGVDTQALSSKTMEAKDVPGLFFIGEVVDVTGWLGGFNFQWAWSSAWACAQALAER